MKKSVCKITFYFNFSLCAFYQGNLANAMRKILSLSVFCCFASAVSLCQPVNDNCGGLLHLGTAPVCPVSTIYSNVNATASVVFSNPVLNIPVCFVGGSVARDVWFAFDVPADGSVVDFTIEVQGISGAGGMRQPQIAVYRGDCTLNGLQEIACASATVSQSLVKLDLLDLTPGLSYFLRINDWSATATPNWGSFTICINKYEPIFVMGQQNFTTICSGKLYDSGGPNGDYQNNENLTFTVCPQSPNQCIAINVAWYATENNYDFLRIYAGNSTNAPLLGIFTGFGQNIYLEAAASCITIQFVSDFFIRDDGFELSWSCSSDPCVLPPPVTCQNPITIPTLPFQYNGTSCSAGNNYISGPCNNDAWMSSEDVVFAYQSSGQECIGVSIQGALPGTAVGLFDNCPSIASNCIALAGAGLNIGNPAFNGAFLQQPGTYYLVVDNPTQCTPFNISVQRVACPVQLPSAAKCENAFSLNGCEGLPAVIKVSPGLGAQGFIQQNVNNGCWGSNFPLNYVWFNFTAKINGEFGFLLQAFNPNEASDIDFQIWGPIPDGVASCDYVRLNQPVRSSYAAGPEPTGLSHIHPVNGLPVTDVCEDQSGDDFVRPLAVQAGRQYVVLINDWGGAITSGAISINFNNTTPGVLDEDFNFSVSKDTTVCPGQKVQLSASGGLTYRWSPLAGLSCTNCHNPVATVTQSTDYQVVIGTACVTDTLSVRVSTPIVSLVGHLTLCLGQKLQLQPQVNVPGGIFQWSAPADFLSCLDCPEPQLTAVAPGQYSVSVKYTVGSCDAATAVQVNVLPNQAPLYQISGHRQLCKGETVLLGGVDIAGQSYQWTSSPPGFNATVANPPPVQPLANTTYYLRVSNTDCPLTILDSVVVTVAERPVIALAPDTVICRNQPVLPNLTPSEEGVIYQWTPSEGLNDTSVANPVATPVVSTVYCLTANRQGCVVKDSIRVNVLSIQVSPSNPAVCEGETVQLQAKADLPVSFTWTPAQGLSCVDCPNPIATPVGAVTYEVNGFSGGCELRGSVEITFLENPSFTPPSDETRCAGDAISLNPTPDSRYRYQWSSVEDPDFSSQEANPIVFPASNTQYQVSITNGDCAPVSFSFQIQVIPPAVVQTAPYVLVCGDKPVALTASANVPGSFTWMPAGTTGALFRPDLQLGLNEFSLIFFAQCDTIEQSITVEKKSGIRITGVEIEPGDTLYQGMKLILKVLTDPPASNWQWSNGSRADTTSVTALQPPSQSWSVTVTDAEGCSADTSITIAIKVPQFDIPNVFTPNNDQLNDVFQVVISGEEVIRIRSMKIWNRWGQLVYQETGSNKGWDGTIHGEPAPSDVYIYKIVLRLQDGSESSFSGDVTLLR